MKTTTKKGQMFSLDLVLSLFVFMVVFILLIMLLNQYSVRFNENIKSEELHLTAFQILDILLRSEGDPKGWETEEDPGNIYSIGLWQNHGRLDPAKLDAFLLMEESVIEEVFNIEHFNFYFEVLDDSGTPLEPPESIGTLPDATSSQSVSIRRIVVVDENGDSIIDENDVRQLSFILWREA